MEKANMTRAMRDFIQSTLPGFPLLSESSDRLLRGPAPVDRQRARAACAPMGALINVVVTEDAHKRRRTWYIVDPDPSMAHHYAAQGFELVDGCKVLIDAEAMSIDVLQRTTRGVGGSDECATDGLTKAKGKRKKAENTVGI